VIRFFIFLLLAYLFFRIVKGVSRLFWGRSGLEGEDDPAKVIDEMIQDPVCETYVPRREAVRKVVQGQAYFFCSDECAEKFKAQRGK